MLVAMLTLSGCGVLSPTPAPTQDTAPLVDMVVKTMNAQQTADALAHPSATPLPTETPVPTQTPPPTATATPAITNTPAATATVKVVGTSAKLLYITTYPENKREFIPNEKFGLAFGFLNNGSTTWAAGFRLVNVSYQGELTAWPEVTLNRNIAPGEKAEFNIAAFGSETLGTHSWVYQVYSDSGVAIPGGSAVFTYTAK